MARLPRSHRSLRRSRLANLGIRDDAEQIARGYDTQTLLRFAELGLDARAT
jgi:hypothetical protein